jgi:hypothetical protein
MVSPVHGDYRRCQAEIPLIVLSKFPQPALSKLSRRRELTLHAMRSLGTGRSVLVLQKDDEPPSMSERNEWDEVNGED